MRSFSRYRNAACGLALLFAAAAWADTPATNFVPGQAPALWFPVGEELVYRVYWGRIPVGTSRVKSEWIEEDGRWLLALRYRTESNRILDKIFPVDDSIESIVEPVSFLPIRFLKKLSEGRYRVDEVTTFDHTNLTARWVSKLKNKTKEFPIEADTRDIPSLMYYLRSQHFTPGERVHFRVMADEKLFDVWVDQQKIEAIDLPGFGGVPSLKIEPEASFNGLFMRQGRGWVWVSEDSRRICTKMVASVPVANIKVLLSEVNGPGDDFWTRAMKERAAGEPGDGN